MARHLVPVVLVVAAVAALAVLGLGQADAAPVCAHAAIACLPLGSISSSWSRTHWPPWHIRSLQAAS
jgi:hypothetical protein